MERRDQLEEFVKNQLADYEELPSKGLWGKIEGAIPIPNRVNSSPWFWGFLGAIVLFTGVIAWHYYRASQWTHQLQDQAKAIQELQVEVEALQEVVAAEEVTVKGNTEVDQAEVVGQATTSLKPPSTPRADFATPKPLVVQRAMPKQAVEDNLPASQPNSQLPNSLNHSPLPTQIIPSAASASSIITAPVLVLQQTAVKPVKEKEVEAFAALGLKRTRNRRWSVGTWMEGTNFHDNPFKALWNRQRRVEDGGANTPSFYANNPSTTKTLGLFVDFDLSRRWSVRTGIGYKEQRRPLGGDFVFAYTLDNSQMNALGHSASPYSYYDESHKIGISTIIANALSNEPNGLEPGELFEMDFSAYQKTNYVSIPLWLTYQMGEGRLKYHLRTGLVWNDLISNSSKIRYLSFSFSQLYYQGHAINDGTIQVGYLDAGLGYGLEYGLNHRFNLYMDGVMYKSITPIFDRQPFSMGVSGGLRYRL